MVLNHDDFFTAGSQSNEKKAYDTKAIAYLR
jgi:hypothetical protein